MALTCARCGTQNPDGNSFCQSCGTPLAAVAPRPPVGPPPVGPPPVGPPPGAPAVMMGPPPDLPPPTYQSPYYAPAPGVFQPPVHRTPWVLIVSAVVGLVVIMAGCGTAFAFLNARNNQTTSDVLPSPSPAGTPSPVPSSTPTEGPGTSSAVSVTVPPGWVASKNDPDITLTNPAGDGSVAVSSGIDNPPQTAQQIKDVIDKNLAKESAYQGIAPCSNTTTRSGSVGGVAGIWWQLCFTATAGGQSFPGEFSLWVGANSSGSVGYGVILFTLQSRMSAFMTEAQPVLASIQWKLK
jgi:zinc ribbon protein